MRCTYISTVLMSQAFSSFIIMQLALINNFVQNHLELIARIIQYTQTYLRNSMTQQRLNQCMLLHVHLKETDQMDLNDQGICKKNWLLWKFLKHFNH